MNSLLKFSTRIRMNRNNKGYNLMILILLVVIMIVGIFLSMGIGSTRIPISEMVGAIHEGDTTSKVYRIVLYVRIPRTLAAVLAGCALSVSGVILQSVLNNSLASPGIIGVNSGAGLFVVLLAAFFPAGMHYTTIAAFSGALVAVLMVYYIARKTGASRMAIVLAGVAVSSFIGAMTDTVLTIKPDVAVERTAFLIGGLSGVTLEKLSFASVFICAALVISMILSYDLNVLALGDESAKSLGLKVDRIRFVFLVLAAMLSGSAISFAGLLGFVGLIVPHVSRIIVGYDNRILIPVSALLGSIFMLMCDLLARVIFAPFEIPVGIIMSFLGGPFFIYLLINRRRGLLYD